MQHLFSVHDHGRQRSDKGPQHTFLPLRWPDCTLSRLRAEEFLSARVPSSSAEVRGLVIHDIKEVEGVRQQEEQEDKIDDEEGDEVNGEVEEITHRAHET